MQSKHVKFCKLLAGWEMFTWTPDLTADRTLNLFVGYFAFSVVICELMATFIYAYYC